jgi:transcriptional regulator with XRE-family HTH domain/tetratricopeptide (TPR) repeat protein
MPDREEKQQQQQRRRGRPPKPLDADASNAARLGVDLRRRREECGLTQEALASLIAFTAQHLSSVERGEASVSERFIQACDDVLKADGQLVQQLPAVIYERAQARSANSARRQLEPISLPSPSMASLALAPAMDKHASPSRNVASTDAEVIGEMVLALRRVDNRFGGGHARGVVLGYLNGEVHRVLRAVQAQGGVPRRLMQVVAELTQLAGWISHDIGEDRLARQYFGESLKLARAAGDEAFTAEVLAGMSQQAAYLGDGRTAVDAAQAATRHANQSDMRALVSEAAAMEAHGYALCGDTRACLVALRNAERTLEAIGDEKRPPWLEYFGAAFLAAKFAHALCALGESKPAERFAVRSLRMSDGYERGRLFNTVLLARVHADAGELDAACELGRRSVAMARKIRSARGLRYLADLRRQLEPHATVPQARELREQIRALAGTG